MDRFNGLADEIICHILSFLPIEEAALTSVLSKRWRNLFAFRPNLQLDDHGVVDAAGIDSFIGFVDNVLSVSGSFPMRNISITCRNSIDADTGPVTRWMSEAVKHGVANLDIDVIAPGDVSLVPLEIFTCKTLVHLRLTQGFEAMIPEDVSLPSLKTLYLGRVYFYNSRYCVLGKLLSACPVLEELTVLGGYWQDLKCPRNVSSSTLKKLTMKCTDCFEYWDINLDTPSLVYLEYSDLPPKKYPTLNLPSLVEAKLDLHSGGGQGNPTNLIKGLRNVEILEILTIRDTGMALCTWREAVPVFINLSRLIITVDYPSYNWEFLPLLLNKSPHLQTLVIKGPLHADNVEREYGFSPVRVLKITEYGGEVGEFEQMKLFFEKLPCLELVKVCAYAITDKEKSRITSDLLMLPRLSMCKVQIKFCEEARPQLNTGSRLLS
ncbi:F-box protein At4g22280 [Raphanus sativus]|uniref:F-box protein At4g22280 n=1 Tax=Raphanus sativus TaxID=3726 RepID=A0A6J0NH15_RAPSA|nr:F-box protein At4g22280 [Raphanus sativus]XP_018483118.1 F-box protein At4g22280 [Raphanus sativus]